MKKYAIALIVLMLMSLGYSQEIKIVTYVHNDG